MIDRARVVESFLELARISSLSRREGEIARRLVAMLEAVGGSVEVDGAGHQVGGEVGNVLARFPGTAPSAPPLLLSGHMDTVPPADKVRPITRGDVIRSDGTTVLGADDKSGLVAILEAVRVVRDERIPHGPIEVLFTICEETGLLGAKHLDAAGLAARAGVVLDCDGVGELITQAPAADHVEVTVHGLEAHAGVAPEQGISAIKVAAEAVAAMRLGRLDDETTANLGIIQGGLAGNIVPNRVFVRGEARSRDLAKLDAQVRHMCACFEEAAARHRITVGDREHAARAETKVRRSYDRLDLPADAPIVRLMTRAAARAGRPFRTRATGGGSDANVLNARGLQVANLACGMREIHTVNEWIDVNDMLVTTRLLVETLRLNAESPE